MCAFPDRRAIAAAALMMSFTGAAANPDDAPADYSHILPLPVPHASQWVVRPQTEVPERPDLRLGWTPASMVFVAGGTPPYSLAFGRTGVRSAHVGLPQVAQVSAHASWPRSRRPSPAI